MKLIKFILNNNSYLAEYKNDKVFPISKRINNLNIFNQREKYIGDPINIDQIKIEPLLPEGKTVYAIAENYNSKKEPIIFFKGISDSAIYMQEKFSISTSKEIEKIWAEAELGFLVSKDIEFGSNFEIDQNYIFGYFLANDLTGTYGDEDHHLLSSKSSQGFLQVGRTIDLDFEPRDNTIMLTQDGLELRKGKISERKINDIEILNLLRKFTKINAGDSILTGAPSRCRERMYLKNHNEIKLFIEELDEIKCQLSIRRF